MIYWLIFDHILFFSSDLDHDLTAESSSALDFVTSLLFFQLVWTSDVFYFRLAFLTLIILHRRAEGRKMWGLAEAECWRVKLTSGHGCLPSRRHSHCCCCDNVLHSCWERTLHWSFWGDHQIMENGGLGVGVYLASHQTFVIYRIVVELSRGVFHCQAVPQGEVINGEQVVLIRQSQELPVRSRGSFRQQQFAPQVWQLHLNSSETQPSASSLGLSLWLD